MIILWDSRKKISSLSFKEQQQNNSIWILWFWTLPPSFSAFATCRTPPVVTEVEGSWESVKLPVILYAFKISNCPNFVNLGTQEGKKKFFYELTLIKECKRKNFWDSGRTTAGSSDPPGVFGSRAPLLHPWRGRGRRKTPTLWGWGMLHAPQVLQLLSQGTGCHTAHEHGCHRAILPLETIPRVTSLNIL